jgi:cytochrome c biogenesis protein CcdA
LPEWINQSLSAEELSVAVIAVAFILGSFGAVTSSCNIALIAAIAGYSGSQQKNQKSGAVKGAVFFLIGSTIAIAILGAVTGLISQSIGSLFGRYWILFAGFVMIFFGMAALDIVPFKLPKIKVSTEIPRSNFKALLFGLAAGGGLATCLTACNPSIFMALGMAALQKQALAAMIIMTAYAIGYSLPLSLVLAGLSAGVNKLQTKLDNFTSKITIVAGLLMIATGLYLLSRIGNAG